MEGSIAEAIGPWATIAIALAGGASTFAYMMLCPYGRQRRREDMLSNAAREANRRTSHGGKEKS